MCVSEICVKQIRVNQGLGVSHRKGVKVIAGINGTYFLNFLDV